MKENSTRKINDLVNYKNIKIIQDKNYFNFSLDSVLLPNFVTLNPNTKMILDLCSGNLPIPLILSTKTNANIYAVELQQEIYDLAKETLKINNLENRITLYNDNAKNMTNKFETDTFDLITCNPPYFKYSDTSLINDNIIKSIARHEIEINIEDIVYNDIVYLTSGDKIPADGILIKGNITVDESMINGEAREMYKESTNNINNNRRIKWVDRQVMTEMSEDRGTVYSEERSQEQVL